RNDEQNAFLGAQDQARVELNAIARDDEVHAFRGPNVEPPAPARHLLGVVGPDAGGVDDLLCANHEFVVSLDIHDLRADYLLALANKANDSCTAGYLRAKVSCGPNDCN